MIIGIRQKEDGLEIGSEKINEKLMQCKLSYNKDEIDLSTMLINYVKTEKEADGSEAP